MQNARRGSSFHSLGNQAYHFVFGIVKGEDNRFKFTISTQNGVL